MTYIYDQKMHHKGWGVIVLASMFYAYQFIVRVFPNALHTDLMQHLNLDAQQLGFVISTYGWAYSLMQIPLGLALDRYGPKLLVSAACLICASGCIVFAFSNTQELAAVGRFMMGMGSSCGFLSCVKLATLWLPPHLLSRSIALTLVFGTIGASMGGGPLYKLNEAIGVKNTLQFLGVVGIVLGLILLKFIQNIHHTQHIPRKSHKDSFYSHSSPMKDFLKVLVHPQSWIIAIFGMLMYAPISALGEAWGIPYVHHTCEVDPLVSSSVVTTMFIGAAVGSPLFTALSEFMRSRRMPMILGAMLSLTLNILLLGVTNPSIDLLKILFFLIGLTYTSKVLTFSSICEIMPKRISGISIAFVNMIVMSTGAIFHPLIGKIIHFIATIGYSDPYNTSVTYISRDYRVGLMVLPIGLVLALFIALFIKETHPERRRRHKSPPQEK